MKERALKKDGKSCPGAGRKEKKRKKGWGGGGEGGKKKGILVGGGWLSDSEFRCCSRRPRGETRTIGGKTGRKVLVAFGFGALVSL